MRLKLSVISILILSMAALHGAPVDLGTTFNRIKMSGRSQLKGTLSDPKVGPTEKELAVRRLSELAKDLPLHKNVKPAELYNPILGVMSLRGKKYTTLRNIACQALINFADKEGSAALIGPLGNVLNNQGEDPDVRRSAAVTLGRFLKDSGAATQQLVRALSSEISRGPQRNNIRLVSTIIGALGRLRDKRSFVPLMRVIQSGFPTSAKRSAQKALENIQWDK